MGTFWARALAAFTVLWASSSLAGVADLSGAWNSQYGALTLQPTPDGYAGRYGEETDQNTGQIRLRYTVSGYFEGEWAQTTSGKQCSTKSALDGGYYWGRVRFKAPSAKQTFTMRWTYCDDADPVRTWEVRPKQVQGQEATPPTASGFEGNWIATWTDSDEPTSKISIHRDFAWDCGKVPCVYRENSAELLAFASPIDSQKLNGISAKKTSGGGSSLTIDWGYGFLGHWGGRSQTTMSRQASASGKWVYGDREGQTIWRRAYPHVQLTQAPKRGNDYNSGVQRAPLGEPLTLRSEHYKPNTSFRGDRQSIFIDLIGQNMWGAHRYFIPWETGLEIRGHNYICADGSVRSISLPSWWVAACNRRGGVRGVRVQFVIWSEAKPGLKTFVFNGQAIPFLLELDGYPEDTKPVELPKPNIDRVVLLDDQLGQRLKPGDRAENYNYPFKPDGAPTGGEDSRMLAIIGKDLTPGGNAYLASADPFIRYEKLELPEHLESAVRQAAIDLSGKPIAQGQQLVIAQAHLSPGIKPGVKTLALSGQDGSWALVFKGQFGKLAYLRPGSTPNSLQEKTFYHNEVLQLGVKALGDDYPIDGLKVVLEAELPPALQPPGPSGNRRLGKFTLRKTDDVRRGENFALSKPILLTLAGDPAAAKPQPDEDAVPVKLRPNENLIMRMQDRLSLIAIPPVERAIVLPAPRRGSLWQSALDKVAGCVGGDSKAQSFPSDTSTVFENWVLTEAVANLFSDKSGSRKTRVTKGDHAALILIRDELLPLIEKENLKLQPYLGTGQAGETKAQRYYSLARQRPNAKNNPFWAAREEPDVYQVLRPTNNPSGSPVLENKSIKLAEMLDFKTFQQKLRKPMTRDIPNIRDTQDVINRIVAKQLKQQYDDTWNAIGRGMNAGNCNVAELLVISGQKAEPAVASLLPDLVKQESGRWVPDIEARRYVSTVYLLGNEVRAMKAYAQIDDAYKSMAVAAAAAPVAFAGSALAASGGAWAGAAGTAAAGLAVGADIADLLYFGEKGLQDYLDGEADYFTALGLSPVLGPDVVREAEAGRASGVLTAVGLLAPGISAGGGLSALDDIAKINKGRAIVRGKDGLKNFDDLTDVQKTEVAAYYKNLRETDASSTSRLSAREKSDLEELNNIVLQKGEQEFGSDSFDKLGFDGPVDESAGTVPPPKGDGTVPPPNKGDETLPPDENLTLPSPAPGEGGDILTEAYEGPQVLAKQPKVERRKTPKTIAELTPSQIGAKDSPFKDKIGEVFDQADDYNGTLVGQSDSAGILRNGVRVEGPDGKEIEFGDLLSDGGGFTNTYKDGTDPENFVIKERFVPDGANNYKAKNSAKEGPESMEILIHDSEVGRELLTDAAKDTDLYRVAKRDGKPAWVRDDEAGGGRYIYREENLAEELPSGQVITNAKDRFAARPDGQPNAAEALTIQMAIRDLNKKGIVWTDSKLSNLDVRPSKNSPTGYEVVYFDFDGFRPVRGETDLDRWKTARTMQQRIDGVATRNDFYATHVAIGRESPFDYRTFGKEMPTPMSVSKNKTGQAYTRLNALDRDTFFREAEETLGKQLFAGQGPTFKSTPAAPSEGAPASPKASALWEKPPGSRLTERSVSREDISGLMAKRARGEPLTEDETLDLIDDARASGLIVFEE